MASIKGPYRMGHREFLKMGFGKGHLRPIQVNNKSNVKTLKRGSKVSFPPLNLLFRNPTYV